MVRVFNTLVGDKKTGKKVYAVTGISTKDSKQVQKAKDEVARFKHDKIGTEYYATPMVIAPYKDGLDGIYPRMSGVIGEPCVMVWK